MKRVPLSSSILTDLLLFLVFWGAKFPMFFLSHLFQVHRDLFARSVSIALSFITTYIFPPQHKKCSCDTGCFFWCFTPFYNVQIEYVQRGRLQELTLWCCNDTWMLCTHICHGFMKLWWICWMPVYTSSKHRVTLVFIRVCSLDEFTVCPIFLFWSPPTHS